MRAAAIVLLVALLTGCSKDSVKESAATTSTARVATVTSTTARATTAITGYVDQGDYVDGRHVAFVTAVDTSQRTITIDVAQFLTGDAATKAYDEDQHTSGPPDDDYYVRNQSKRLRTFTVTTSPQIHLQNLGHENGAVPSAPDQGGAVTFAEFAGYFSGEHAAQAKATLFWITLQNGTATRIEEQFTP